MGPSDTLIYRNRWGFIPGMEFGLWKTASSPIQGVNDSKKLTEKRRQEVFHRILRYDLLLDFGIGEVSVEEIDRYGIDKANDMVFSRAVHDLNQPPDYVLLDGDNPLMGWDMTLQQHRPKGDGLWWPVGAASILAKVIRDSYMEELSLEYPSYQWARNAGYGTAQHTQALQSIGACSHHRKQFIHSIVGRSA